MKSVNKKARICSAFLLLALSHDFLIVQPVEALGVPMASKRQSMLIPTYEKLFQGAGPATNDKEAQSEKTFDSAGGTNSADLSPLTLNENKQNGQTIDNSNNNGAVLKSTVSETDYLPRSNTKLMQAQSIKGDRKHNNADKGSIIDQATAVKVGPLPLLESENEAEKREGTLAEAEKLQLADLWEATLTRSPDIQFIVQKLQPTTNQAHLTNYLAKALSTAAFGGLGAMSMMSPNIGTYAAASMGGSMIQSALGMTQSKADKRAKLSQEEELMMYKMVRETCDKLVSYFRDYKKSSNNLNRAFDDFQDLQNMFGEAKSQDAAKQFDMEYTLRKQKRDMEIIAEDVKHHKQNLVDLAGVDAVTHLDRQLTDERERVKQLAGGNSEESSIKNTLDDANSEKPKTAARVCPQS